MSHFSVLVIGKDVDRQLQPYHEYESTGTDGQYVVDVDDTEENREEYEANTVRRLRGPDGVLHDPYDAEFYRVPTAEEREKMGKVAGTGCSNELSWHSRDWGDGRGYAPRTHCVPDGFEDVQIPWPEYGTFRQFLKYWTEREEVLPGDRREYGWTEVTDLGPDGDVVRTVKRTNPNAKWDWWVIGGRWSGFLQLKPENEGLSVDVAFKGNIDFETKMNEAGEAAAAEYDRVVKVADGRRWVSWPDVRENKKDFTDSHKRREFYCSQQVVKDIREALGNPWDDVDEYLETREAYVERARRQSITTFAVVKDGKWYQRGDMGWWGATSNEMSDSEWYEQFQKLLADLDDDTVLTVVDCHI